MPCPPAIPAPPRMRGSARPYARDVLLASVRTWRPGGRSCGTPGVTDLLWRRTGVSAELPFVGPFCHPDGGTGIGACGASTRSSRNSREAPVIAGNFASALATTEHSRQQCFWASGTSQFRVLRGDRAPRNPCKRRCRRRDSNPRHADYDSGCPYRLSPVNTGDSGPQGPIWTGVWTGLSAGLRRLEPLMATGVAVRTAPRTRPGHRANGAASTPRLRSDVAIGPQTCAHALVERVRRQVRATWPDDR
jgi:hypothetical protein